MKIAVLGYSGAGKSTLAAQLSKQYGIPVLHLDTVQFLPGWKERPRKQAQRMVSDFMEQPDWVIDGNYSQFYQSERLEQADTILLLCFGRFRCLYRVWKRYRNNRGKVRESMAEGCEEKLDWEFICWVLFKGRNRKKRDIFLKIRGQYPQKTVLLKNPRQVKDYLGKIEKEMERSAEQ